MHAECSVPCRNHMMPAEWPPTLRAESPCLFPDQMHSLPYLLVKYLTKPHPVAIFVLRRVASQQGRLEECSMPVLFKGVTTGNSFQRCCMEHLVCQGFVRSSVVLLCRALSFHLPPSPSSPPSSPSTVGSNNL